MSFHEFLSPARLLSSSVVTKSAIAVFPLLTLPLASSGATVTGWVVTNGNAGFSGGSETTASPILTDADSETITANFTSTTLIDGDSLALTGSFSVNVPLVDDQFRIGLFNGDNPVTAGDGLGYVGIYAGAPGAPGGPFAFGAFVESGDGTASDPFSQSASTSLGTMPATAVQPGANTPIDFVLSITRDGSNLDIFASFTDGGSYNSSIDLQDQAINYFSYDSVGFLVGSTLNGTSASFSDVDVTVTPIPEPSAFVLGLLGTLVLLRRRR